MATQPVTNVGPQPVAPATSGETELFRQSYSLKIPKNVDGIKELCTPTQEDVDANKDNKNLVAGEFNEDICTRIFRAGLKQLTNNALRQTVTSLDKDGNPAFTPVDGVFDVTKLLFRQPGREFLSEREQLEANLRENPAMTDAAIQQILTIWDGQVGKETGNTSIQNSEVVVTMATTTDKAGKTKTKLNMKVPTKKEKEDGESEE